MEAFNFTVANEDCCLYTYDMRKLQAAACVHHDFVSSVMDVDYSPTGREFVAGSYDRSVRIFSFNGGHSREVYHATRMQRVFAVRFSGDGTYVFSGSDDMNVRMWKANASQQLGTTLPRERQKHEYNQALVKRYQHLPEVKRITRHRHLPTPIYKAGKLRRTMMDADKRKERNRVTHSAPGSVVVKPARKKKIVAELE
jgi:WD repeat and SOF domain-containing protein 1